MDFVKKSKIHEYHFLIAKNEQLNLGLVRVNGSMPAERCVELIDNQLKEYELSFDKHIVCITTDGASVMTKVEKIIKSNQQLCLVHGIQLAVIKVLYSTTPVVSTNTNVDIDDDHSENKVDEE